MNVSLPFNPEAPGAAGASPLPNEAQVLAYQPDGRLLAINAIETADGQLVGLRLVEVHADGTFTDLGEIEQPDVGFGWERALDLVVDAEGRLFLLASAFFQNPPISQIRLVELSPTDASLISNRGLNRQVEWIAKAPSGLWAKTENGLELLDPESGRFTFIRDEGFSLTSDGETDSTGALWMFESPGFCSPPCTSYSRFDPATGSLTEGYNLLVPVVVPRDLTLRPTCQSSPTVMCLQGGRFQAEVTWTDFDGNQGDGVVAAARSADSGLFWFFDAANWEITVKVLDSCRGTGHFWVFASGSTNVAFTLKVTDLETGDERFYENPLGRTAVTVTDTTAFDCG